MIGCRPRHFSAPWPWAGHLPSPSRSCLICPMGIILTLQACCGTKIEQGPVMSVTGACLALGEGSSNSSNYHCCSAWLPRAGRSFGPGLNSGWPAREELLTPGSSQENAAASYRLPDSPELLLDLLCSCGGARLENAEPDSG